MYLDGRWNRRKVQLILNHLKMLLYDFWDCVIIGGRSVHASLAQLSPCIARTGTTAARSRWLEASRGVYGLSVHRIVDGDAEWMTLALSVRSQG